MSIELSNKYDFCGLKDLFINGKKAGRVLKYSDGSFEIEVQKVIQNPNQSAYTIHRTITTTNESLIIQLVRNFINNH